MDIQLLSKYLHLFGDLHRHASKDKGAAPHKPILLLTLLDEIEHGYITTNFVPITLQLVVSFRNNWRAYAPPGWKERLVYPFRYLVQDTFWDLIKNGVVLHTKEVGNPTTLRQLQEKIDGGRFADDLWLLLQDQAAIHELRGYLLGKYFGLTIDEAQPLLTPDPISYEIEKLKAEANSKYRVKKAREKVDDTLEYVRHGLFPGVIKSLYENTCAVCSLAARTDNTTIVDAAHIKPFSIFHYDGIENGIALCKNHHWGFDAGWFTISDDYKILVSPQLRNVLGYVTADRLIRLPSNTIYAPAQTALSWHRDTKFLK